jgi:hypothetical protein
MLFVIQLRTKINPLKIILQMLLIIFLINQKAKVETEEEEERVMKNIIK